MNTLERFHIYNETKSGNQINDKCTVIPNLFFDTLILKYTNRGQSPLKLPLPTVTSLSHNLQHNQHVLLLNSTTIVIIRMPSHTSYFYRSSTSNYTKYLLFQNHFHVEKTSIITPDIHSLNTVYE